MDLGTKIIGFRAWTIQEDGYLHALGLSNQAWGRGPNVAVCNKRDSMAWKLSAGFSDVPRAAPDPCKDAPGHGCECGLYAYHENKWKVTPGPFVNPAVQVPGVIAAWGRMEVHNKGFRAQKAEIVALGFNPNWLRSTVDRIKTTARDYEVECMPLDRLAHFAAEYGQIVPAEERPALEPKKKPAPKAAIQKALPGDVTREASAFGRYYLDYQRQLDAELKRQRRWWDVGR